VQKTAGKNTEYSRNETILKISLSKVYSPCKLGSLGWNFFFQKHAKIASTRTVELFCAKKNRWKKHRIFEKWDHFAKSIAHTKPAFCFAFFFPKTCQKWFYKNSVREYSVFIFYSDEVGASDLFTTSYPGSLSFFTYDKGRGERKTVDTRLIWSDSVLLCFRMHYQDASRAAGVESRN